MDKTKLFAKDKIKIRIYSQVIGMEFGIEKCAIHNGKYQITEGVELPNKEKITTFGGKENYKY